MMVPLYVFTMMWILKISNGATTVDPSTGQTSSAATVVTTVSPPLAADKIPSRQPVPEPNIPDLINRGFEETSNVAYDVLGNTAVQNTMSANIVDTLSNSAVEYKTVASIVVSTNKPIPDNRVVENTTPENLVIAINKQILDNGVVENTTPGNTVVTTGMPPLRNAAIGFDPLLAPVTKMQNEPRVGNPIEITLPQSKTNNTVLQETSQTYKIANNPVPTSSDVTTSSLPVSQTTAPEKTTQGQDQQTTTAIQMTQGTNGQEAVAAYMTSVTNGPPSFETTTLVAKETTKMFPTSTVQTTQSQEGTNLLRSVVETSQGAEQNLYRTATSKPNGTVHPSSSGTTTQNIQATNAQNIIETKSQNARETTVQNIPTESPTQKEQATPERNHGTTAANIVVSTSKSTHGKEAVEYTTLAKTEVTTGLPTFGNVAVDLASTINGVKTTKPPVLAYEYATSSDIVGSTTISPTLEGSSVTQSSKTGTTQGTTKVPIGFDPLLSPLAQTQNAFIGGKPTERTLPHSKANNTFLQETGQTYKIANNPVPTSSEVTTNSLPVFQTTAPEKTTRGQDQQTTTAIKMTQGTNGQEAVAAYMTSVTNGPPSFETTTLVAKETTKIFLTSTVQTTQSQERTNLLRSVVETSQGAEQNLYRTATSKPNGTVHPSSSGTTTQNIQATNAQNILETTSQNARETTVQNLPAASTTHKEQATFEPNHRTTAANIVVSTSKSTHGKEAVEHTTLAKTEVTTGLPTFGNVAVDLASTFNGVKTTKLPVLAYEYATSSDIVGSTTISPTLEGSSVTPSSNTGTTQGTTKVPIGFDPLLSLLAQTQNEYIGGKPIEITLPQSKANITVLQKTGQTYKTANNPVPTLSDVTTTSIPVSQTTVPEKTTQGHDQQTSTTTAQGANGPELLGAVAAHKTIVITGQNSLEATTPMAEDTTETIPISTIQTLQAQNGTNLLQPADQTLQGTTGENLFGTTPMQHGAVNTSATGTTNQGVQARNIHNLLEKTLQNLPVASTVKQVQVTPEPKLGTTSSIIVLTTNKPTLYNAAVEYTTPDKTWVKTSMPIFGKFAIDHVSSTSNGLMTTKLPDSVHEYTTSSGNGDGTTVSPTPEDSPVTPSLNMVATQGTAKGPIAFDPLLAPQTGTQNKSGVGKSSETTLPQPKAKNTVLQGTDPHYIISNNPVPTSHDATTSLLPVSQNSSPVVTKGTTEIISSSTVQTIQARKETNPLHSGVQNSQGTTGQELNWTTTKTPYGAVDAGSTGKTSQNVTNVTHLLEEKFQITKGTTGQNRPASSTTQKVQVTADHNLGAIPPMVQGTTDVSIQGRTKNTQTMTVQNQLGTTSPIAQGTTNRNLTDAATVNTSQANLEQNMGNTTPMAQGTTDGNILRTASPQNVTEANGHIVGAPSHMTEGTGSQNLSEASTTQTLQATTELSTGTTLAPQGAVDTISTGTTFRNAQTTILQHLGALSNKLQDTTNVQNLSAATVQNSVATNQNITTTPPMTKGSSDLSLGLKTATTAQGTFNSNFLRTGMSQNSQGTTQGETFGTNQIVQGITDANVLGTKTLQSGQATTQVSSFVTSSSTGQVTTEPTPLGSPDQGGTGMAASASNPAENALKAKFDLVSLTEMMKNLAKETTIASPCDNYICSTVAPHCVLVQQKCNASQCPVGPECSDNALTRGWCNSGHLVLDELFQQISCNPGRQDSCPQHSVCDGSKEVHKCCWIGTVGAPASNTSPDSSTNPNTNGSSKNSWSRSQPPHVATSIKTDKTISINTNSIGSSKQKPASSFGAKVKIVDQQPNSPTVKAVDPSILKAVGSIKPDTQLLPGDMVTGQVTSINTNAVDKPMSNRLNHQPQALVNHVSNGQIKPINTNFAIGSNQHVSIDPLTPTKNTITVQSMPKNTNVASPQGNAENGVSMNTNLTDQSPQNLIDTSLPAQLKATADQKEFRNTNLAQNENILSGNARLLQTPLSTQGNFSPSRSKTVQNLSMLDKGVQSKPLSSQQTTTGTNTLLTNFNKSSSQFQTDGTSGTAHASSSLGTNIGAASANADKQKTGPIQTGLQVSSTTTTINENVKTSPKTGNKFSAKPDQPGAGPDFALPALQTEFPKTDQRLSKTFGQNDNIYPSVSISSPGQERVYRAPTPYTATGHIENPIPLTFSSQDGQMGTYRPGDIIIDIPTASTNTNHATISGVTKTGVIHLGTHPIGLSAAASLHTPPDTPARQSAGPDTVRSFNSQNLKNILSAAGVSMIKNIQSLPAETTMQQNQNSQISSGHSVSRSSIKSAMPLHENTLTDQTNVPLPSTVGNFKPSQNEPPMVGKTNIHSPAMTPALRNANIPNQALNHTMHTDGIVQRVPVISHTNPVNANGQITASSIPLSKYMQGDRARVLSGGNIQHPPAGSSINHDARTLVSGHNQGSPVFSTTLPVSAHTQKGQAFGSSIARGNHIQHYPQPIPPIIKDAHNKGSQATGSPLSLGQYYQGGHTLGLTQGGRNIQGGQTSGQRYPTDASKIPTIHSTIQKTGHIQSNQKTNSVLPPRQNNGHGLAVGSSKEAHASNYKSQTFSSNLPGDANIQMIGSSVPRSAIIQTDPTVGSAMARDSAISGSTHGAPMTELSNSRTSNMKVPATSGLQRNTLSKPGLRGASKPRTSLVRNIKTKLDAQPYQPLSQPKQNPTSLKTTQRRTRIQTMVHVKPHGNGHNITKTIKITSPRSNKRNLPITVKSNVFRQTPVIYQDHMGQRRKAPAYGVAISTTVGKHVTKPGFCYKPCGPDICANDCIHDGQCPGVKKCCNTGCGHVCTDPFPVLPITKQGTCPVPTKIKSCPNVRKCNHDGQCPESSKCCCISAACRVCVPQKNLLSSQPITHSKKTTVSTSGNKTDITTHISSTIITKNRPVRHKPGFCHLPCGPFQCTKECSNDGQCPRESKCCNTGCGRVCSSPLPRIPMTKPGHCPAHNPSRACPRVTQCRHDNECPGSAKCCCIGPSCRVCVTQGSPLYLMSGLIPALPFLK